MPLEKESLNNFLPDGFETNNLDGYKENFSADKIATGYEKDVKDRVSGPNFNNLLDVIGKNTNVLTKFMDFIKNMPVNNLFAVDENNQLVYKNLDEVGGGGLEIGDIGIAPLGINESKGKRRYLNGQIILQEPYQSFTAKLKEAIALYPSLACSESEWQATALLTVGGQVGKFVVDNDAGTIRLPKIIMPIQGLTDLSKLAEIVEAGLPNITGTFRSDGADKYSGACYEAGDITGAGISWSSTSGSDALVGLDASRSSSTYGNSNTVQQEQIQYPYFIQVATGAETKDEIENEQVLNNPFFIGYSQYFENAPYNLSWSVGGSTLTRAVHAAYYDALLIELNADIEVGTTQNNYTKRGLPVKLATDSDITDYDFVVNTAEETFTLPLLNGSEDLPSDRFETLQVTSEYYTAKANGVVYLRGSVNTASDKIGLQNHTSNVDSVQRPNATGATVASYLPVKRGDVFGLEATSKDISRLTIEHYRFIYAQGNGSLYFYVGEVAQNTNLINAGRIEEIKANKTDVDGQWVYKYLQLGTDLSFNSENDQIFDLTDYLPNDGYNYEIIVCIHGRSSTSSGNNIDLGIFSDIIPLEAGGIRFGGAITRTSSFAFGSSALTMPIGTGRLIGLHQNSTSSCTNTQFRAFAYRRIGKNV